MCGHCWKNMQLAESTFWHQCCVTTQTISKCSSSISIHSQKTKQNKNPCQISKYFDTAFQNLSSFIFLDIFNLNRENFIQHLMSKYLEC